VTDCPCGQRDARGRAVPFPRCCGQYLADFEGKPAPDAQTLMRSRYCAFVLRDDAYLLATWHTGTRPAHVEFDDGAKWLGLDVRDFREQDASHAEVEFVARLRIGGRAVRLHERSRFVRESGRWYYVDGEEKAHG
jgi:SEC-C motif domain protein